MVIKSFGSKNTRGRCLNQVEQELEPTRTCMSYNQHDRGGSRPNHGGFDRGNFNRGPERSIPVEPPVQCAHVDEQGNQCSVMITELPFELRRDENGNPERPVYCGRGPGQLNHVQEHRAPRRDFRPRY